VHAQDEEVNFDVFEAMKYPRDTKECFRVNILYENCTEQQKRIRTFDHLMKTLVIDEIDKEKEREVKKCWEKFGKTWKIPKSNDQKQRRPHEAVELEDLTF